VEALAVIAIIAILLAIFLPALNRAREASNRIKCAGNLRSIGQAIHLYIRDHTQFPRMRCDPYSSLEALFATDDDTATYSDNHLKNNVTAGYYLLVRQGYVRAEMFLCPSALREKTWIRDNGDPRTIRKYADFTWARPCSSILSYSFAIQYPNIHACPDYRPPPNQPGDFAVGADANSGMTAGVRPDSRRELVRRANSHNHRWEGQNVLYMDGHVSWQSTSFCGHDGDCIYRGGIAGPWVQGVHDTVLLPERNMWEMADGPISW